MDASEAAETLCADPIEICIELLEGRSVWVPTWHSSSALRRAVYRRMKDMEKLYGGKTVKIVCTLQSEQSPDGVAKLSPDLTKEQKHDKLVRRAAAYFKYS